MKKLQNDGDGQVRSAFARDGSSTFRRRFPNNPVRSSGNEIANSARRVLRLPPRRAFTGPQLPSSTLATWRFHHLARPAPPRLLCGHVLTLAREIEAQGVGRKVAADMFDLALRTYQRKVQRLGETVAARDRSLWEMVLQYVTREGRVFKTQVISEFQREGEADVIAVLADLVASGLLYSSGRGEAAIYCATSDADRRAITNSENLESAASIVWAAIYRHPGVTLAELALEWRSDVERIRSAVTRLVAEGRVRREHEGDDAPLRAETLLVPVGAQAQPLSKLGNTAPTVTPFPVTGRERPSSGCSLCKPRTSTVRGRAAAKLFSAMIRRRIAATASSPELSSRLMTRSSRKCMTTIVSGLR